MRGVVTVGRVTDPAASAPLPFAPPPLDAHTALFLDFDGTLAAIAPRPDAVVVGGWVVPTLERLRSALGGALALVSGRPLTELDAFVAPLRLSAAGVHGVERRDAAGRLQVQQAVLPTEVLAVAEQLAARHPQLVLERKPAALALHYRAVPAMEEVCVRTLQAAVRPHAGWMVLLGKCVAEVKPRGASKSQAVRAFLSEHPFTGRRPVFVGDDATDEDGFAAVQSLGGVGVKVGPGPSVARHRLADPEAVRRWLSAVDPVARETAGAQEVTR